MLTASRAAQAPTSSTLCSWVVGRQVTCSRRMASTCSSQASSQVGSQAGTAVWGAGWAPQLWQQPTGSGSTAAYRLPSLAACCCTARRRPAPRMRQPPPTARCCRPRGPGCRRRRCTAAGRLPPGWPGLREGRRAARGRGTAAPCFPPHSRRHGCASPRRLQAGQRGGAR